MDDAADDVAKVFANGQPYEVFDPPQGPPAQIFKLQPTELASSQLPFAKRRRQRRAPRIKAAGRLGRTNPNDSVTNEDGRFHNVGNAYVAGPAGHFSHFRSLNSNADGHGVGPAPGQFPRAPGCSR